MDKALSTLTKCLGGVVGRVFRLILEDGLKINLLGRIFTVCGWIVEPSSIMSIAVRTSMELQRWHLRQCQELYGGLLPEPFTLNTF